jgi:DNA-binding MarR family transcriptional regulator
MNALRYTVHIVNARQKEDTATLEILQTIEDKSDVTQRHLADQLDVALGLANSYLKRCVRKGLVKIHQAPANRYLYYLTPKGFAEKSRLTTEYLSSSFNFYRRASISCSDVFEKCHELGLHKVLLCGLSELAEIASLRASEQEIDIVGTLALDSKLKVFLGLPVWNSFDLLSDFDACVVTEVVEPQKLIEYMSTQVNSDIVFVPDILGIKNESKNNSV